MKEPIDLFSKLSGEKRVLFSDAQIVEKRKTANTKCGSVRTNTSVAAMAVLLFSKYYKKS